LLIDEGIEAIDTATRNIPRVAGDESEPVVKRRGGEKAVSLFPEPTRLRCVSQTDVLDAAAKFSQQKDAEEKLMIVCTVEPGSHLRGAPIAFVDL
jgi:hypothetical protein